MQQPKLPNASPPTAQKPSANGNRKPPPTPKEMIAMYESKGMETQEAAVKVIEDLQGVLFRMASTRRVKKDKFMAETVKKMEITQARLAIVEKKIDSKPGIGQSFVIGLASGAALNGLGSVWVNVVSGVGQIWSAVTRVTKSPSSPA